MLQYNFHAHFEDDAIKGLRRTYHLADGGKSDNLGLIPLLERGVETIIVSQMGKEGDDFEDIVLAANQAERLFGCKFKSDWPRDIEMVVTTNYQCPGENNTTKEGTLILVRPTTKNIADFMTYLANQHPTLHAYLVNRDIQVLENNRFPETPTFRKTYPPELIRSYFLLGRYLAMTSVYNAVTNIK